jgi:hypothetical protein
MNPATRITPQALAASTRVGTDFSAAVRDRAGRIAGREGRGVVTEGDVERAVEEMQGAQSATAPEPARCKRCNDLIHPADRCVYCRDGVTCPDHDRPRKRRDAEFCSRECQAQWWLERGWRNSGTSKV